MANIKQSVATKIIDANTGTILESVEKNVINWGQEPPFVKIYLKDILYLKDLPKSYNPLLLALLKRAGWAKDGMEISLTAGTKRLIAKELNLQNIRTINNALSNFVKADVLFRVETGVYRFNPYLFGKGDWQDISKLRLQIEYTLEGKTFNTVVTNSKDNDDKDQITLDEGIL